MFTKVLYSLAGLISQVGGSARANIVAKAETKVAVAA